jgi:hypothetical protein
VQDEGKKPKARITAEAKKGEAEEGKDMNGYCSGKSVRRNVLPPLLSRTCAFV